MGLLILMSGFRGNELRAVHLAKAMGDISGSEAIVWEHGRDTPYVPSPLLYGNILYFLKSNDGIISAFNTKTGKAHYGPKRLQGVSGVYASIVGCRGSHLHCRTEWNSERGPARSRFYNHSGKYTGR